MSKVKPRKFIYLYIYNGHIIEEANPRPALNLKYLTYQLVAKPKRKKGKG